MNPINALITNVVNNLFHIIWFCNLVPETKYGKKKTALIVTGTVAVYQLLALAGYYLYSSQDSARELPEKMAAYRAGYLLAVVLLGVMFYFWISKLDVVKSLFIIAVYYSLWTLIYLMVSTVTGLHFGGGNLWMWSLRAVLNLAFLIPYRLFFRERFYRMCKGFRSGKGLITALAIFAFFNMSLLLFYYDVMGGYDPVYLFMLISFYCFMIVVYVLIFRYIAQSDNEQRLRQMKSHEELLQSQMDSYAKLAENVRQTRHDFRHHNTVVMEYAKKGDCQGILDYLQEYEERETEKYAVIFTSNHIVDTVLSAYADKCRKRGITFRTDIRLDETPEVLDYDMVTILANILENAVNGCADAAQECIVEVQIRQKRNKLILVCRNTCAEHILFEDGIPKSADHEGVGVDSILSAAARYGGNVDFSAKNGVFTCRVILNDRKVGEAGKAGKTA